MRKDKGFGVAARFERAYDLEWDTEVYRFALWILKILDDGPKQITSTPLETYFFMSHGDVLNREQIARGLRSAAYKIQKRGK